MAWLRVRFALVALLSVYVLLNDVAVRFTPFRQTLVSSPASGEHGQTIDLAGLERMADPQFVLSGAVRNLSASTINLWVGVGGQAAQRVRLAARATTHFAIAWQRPAPTSAPYRAMLTGSAGTWTLEQLDLANDYGFTGGVRYVRVLPRGQPFSRAPAWSATVLLACGLLLLTAPPSRGRSGGRLQWRLPAVAITSFLAGVAVCPLLSSFKVVLSPETFVACMLGVAASRLPGLGHRLWTGVAMASMMFGAAGRRLRFVPWLPVLAAAGGVAYTMVLVTHVGAYAGGADSSGYLNNARLLGRAQVSSPLRTVAGVDRDVVRGDVYLPLGYRMRYGSDDAMTPTYPIGLPLSLVATAKVTGWALAPHATMVWHALLGVGLMYALGQMVGLSPAFSALGALLLATSAQYLFSSLSLMSDTPALVWTTATVLLCWRSRVEARVAGMAGMTLAMAVMVRPTNALLLAPLAVCLGVSPRRWAWLCAGGAPGAALQFIYNATTYGHPLRTGYGGVSGAFAAANVADSLHNYAEWLPLASTPLVVLAAGLPFLWRRSPRLVTVLVSWILSYGVAYAFYSNTHEAWWYLRFLLPAFPPLIAGALLVARRLMDVSPLNASRGWTRHLTAVCALAIATATVASNVVWDQRLHVLDIGDGERVYPDAAEWARAYLPRGSAVLAMQIGGALMYYTDFPVLRWDRLDRRQSAALTRALEASHHPLYAVLYPFEVEQTHALTRVVPGTWTQVWAVRHVTVWRYDGPSADKAP